MEENEITYKIIGAAYNVYNGLGPGLLESTYQKVFAYELRKQGLNVIDQLPVPIMYDGKIFGEELKADMLVENKVIIELKSVDEIRKVYYKQLMTYLKLKGLRFGLLINFNCTDFRNNGIHRVANGF